MIKRTKEDIADFEKLEIENALNFYANSENYAEREYRTPHCHSWWEVPIQEDKGKRAKAILDKYFIRER